LESSNFYQPQINSQFPLGHQLLQPQPQLQSNQSPYLYQHQLLQSHQQLPFVYAYPPSLTVPNNMSNYYIPIIQSQNYHIPINSTPNNNYSLQPISTEQNIS